MMGGGAAAAYSYALGGWDTSASLATTANPGGIAGSAAAGVSVVVAFRLNALPVVNFQYLADRRSGNSGWMFRADSSSGLSFFAGNGAALAVNTRFFVAGDVDKFHVVAGTVNLTTASLFYDRASVSSSALVGYAEAAVRTSVASNGTAHPGAAYEILGIAGRDSPLTLADYQTICDATKLAGVLALGGITMEHSWSAVQSPTVPSIFPDGIGVDDLSFIVGSAANVTSIQYARTWGF
jgi:hypothetical protein